MHLACARSSSKGGQTLKSNLTSLGDGAPDAFDRSAPGPSQISSIRAKRLILWVQACQEDSPETTASDLASSMVAALIAYDVGLRARGGANHISRGFGSSPRRVDDGDEHYSNGQAVRTHLANFQFR